VNSFTSSFRTYVATLLALVAATFLVGLSASEWLVRTLVEPNDQFPAHLRLFHSAQEPNAGFGDSHIACGFYPPDGMVNLAFPSESIGNMQYKVLKYFKNRAPARVILQADAHMFARYRTVPSPGYNQWFDRKPNEQSEFLAKALNSYHRPKLFAYWKVWFLKGGFESRTKLSPKGWTECADRWLTVDAETRKTRARERAMLHEPAEDFSRSDFAIAYQRLIEDLVRMGARVCMVEFPVTPEYQQAISGHSYQAAREWFSKQAKRLSLRYLAHAGVYADRIELFSDMDHLNAQGAQEFSRRMLTECFE
jgi:hypothetical protein